MSNYKGACIYTKEMQEIKFAYIYIATSFLLIKLKVFFTVIISLRNLFYKIYKSKFLSIQFLFNLKVNVSLQILENYFAASRSD